ncbi:MAG: glycosyltransferase family 4 protein [Acidimicrobiia bacterium]|nr:glycosyltransferase family 4 protein [Acidimicrobiia bacterium]
MRVFVVETDGAGGMIHYAYQLCTALAQGGAEVSLVTSRHYELGRLPHSFSVQPLLRLWPNIEPSPGPAGRCRLLARRAGYKVRRGWRALRFAREWWRLTRYLLRERPDVVQFGVIRFPFQEVFLRRLRRGGLYLAQVCHEYEFRESRHPLLRRLSARWARRVYPSFSAVFLHSEADRERFLGLYPVAPERTHLIPHGNEFLFPRLVDPGGDLRERYGLPAARPVALFFGGLRPSKGLPDLIEAYALALAEVDAYLVIAGYPAYGLEGSALEAQAQQLGIADRVVVDARYLALEEIGPLLRTATVAVLPYRNATASGALQVAYAFGRPVIATTVGGLPDAVEDGVTGLLVPPADPPALARALVKLLSDPDEALRMGAQGRAAAEERYSWGPIAGAILDVYRRERGQA